MSYYSDHSKEYIDSTISTDMAESYALFEPYLPKGGKILDVGFGSGRDMLYFKSKGYEVRGIDIEEAFISHASSLGLEVEAGDVLTYSTKDKFDGIWASACLLHLKKEEVGKAINNLLSLLKEDGVLFVSMKEGNQEGYDDRGRWMLYVDESIFKPFHVLSIKRLYEQGRGLTWINAIIKR